MKNNDILTVYWRHVDGRSIFKAEIMPLKERHFYKNAIERMLALDKSFDDMVYFLLKYEKDPVDYIDWDVNGDRCHFYTNGDTIILRKGRERDKAIREIRSFNKPVDKENAETIIDDFLKAGEKSQDIKIGISDRDSNHGGNSERDGRNINIEITEIEMEYKDSRNVKIYFTNKNRIYKGNAIPYSKSERPGRHSFPLNRGKARKEEIDEVSIHALENYLEKLNLDPSDYIIPTSSSYWGGTTIYVYDKSEITDEIIGNLLSSLFKKLIEQEK